MNLILLILFGTVVGLAAAYSVKTRTPQSTAEDVILGILGSLTGGIILDFAGSNFSILTTAVVSLVGSLILVIIGKALSKSPA